MLRFVGAIVTVPESQLPLSLEAFGEVIQAHGKTLLRKFLVIGVRAPTRPLAQSHARPSLHCYF